MLNSLSVEIAFRELFYTWEMGLTLCILCRMYYVRNWQHQDYREYLTFFCAFSLSISLDCLNYFLMWCCSQLIVTYRSKCCLRSLIHFLFCFFFLPKLIILLSLISMVRTILELTILKNWNVTNIFLFFADG